MSIADPISYPTKGGIGCRFPIIHYVMIDQPDAHLQYFRFRSVRPVLNIQPSNHASRPRHKEAMQFWQVSDEIHDWIVSSGYQYCIDRRWATVNGAEVLGWMVGFREKSEAAHFKLSWANV